MIIDDNGASAEFARKLNAGELDNTPAFTTHQVNKNGIEVPLPNKKGESTIPGIDDKPKQAETDFSVTGEGNIYLFHPNNERAVAFLENFDEAQFFGRSLVAEHRYVTDITSQLREEGFSVS